MIIDHHPTWTTVLGIEGSHYSSYYISSLQILAKVTIHIDAKPKFSIKKKEDIYDVSLRRSDAEATAREPIKSNLTGLNGFCHNRKYPSIAGPTRRYGTYEVPDEE